MDKETSSAEVLASKVARRQNFLQELIEFATKVLVEHGKVTSYKEHSCHTTIKRELENFLGFSLCSYGSYTMYGGEYLKLWYPKRADKNTEPTLEVEWWNIEKLTVKKFDPSQKWQTAIKRLIRDHQRAKARHLQEEARAKARQEKLVQQEQDRQGSVTELAQDAQRLGL